MMDVKAIRLERDAAGHSIVVDTAIVSQNLFHQNKLSSKRKYITITTNTLDMILMNQVRQQHHQQ